MVLFNKEPETSSSPDPTAALTGFTNTQSLDDKNVALVRDGNHRESHITVNRSSDAHAYLDSRTQINGQLSFEGPARIDGQIDGEIVSRTSLVIGHDALVKAKIKATAVVVAGTVIDEISASERIELQPSAKMSGNLAAPRIAVHEGALFEGNCMTSKARGEQLKPTEIRRENRIDARAAAQN